MTPRSALDPDRDPPTRFHHELLAIPPRAAGRPPQPLRLPHLPLPPTSHRALLPEPDPPPVLLPHASITGEAERAEPSMSAPDLGETFVWTAPERAEPSTSTPACPPRSSSSTATSSSNGRRAGGCTQGSDRRCETEHLLGESLPQSLPCPPLLHVLVPSLIWSLSLSQPLSLQAPQDVMAAPHRGMVGTNGRWLPARIRH